MICILHFKHKGPGKFFTKSSKPEVRAAGAAKRNDHLALLQAAPVVGDSNNPNNRLHELQVKLKGHWVIDVAGKWRIAFRFEDGSDYVVKYGARR